MTDFQNPRAFPSSAIDDRFGGMSLWDYFAAQALPAIIETAVGTKVDPAIIAQGAGAVADAMMAKRAERTEADPFTPDALSSAARKLHRAGHLSDADLARICNRIDAAARVREDAANV